MRSGARAEDAAAQALLDAGLELVARNVRVGRLEIDPAARAVRVDGEIRDITSHRLDPELRTFHETPIPRVGAAAR